MTTQTTETFAEIGIPVNPFPGLRPFEFDESHLFFGREGQSEQLIGKLGRTRFLAVVGTSGSGKSSLVRAGLLPSLLGGFMTSAGSDWRVAILRPGNDPIGNLARALNAPDVLGSDIEENAALQTALAEATLRRGSLGLVDAVRQAVMPDNENLLVVVDQFEEIFRFARVAESEEYKNESAAFVKLILEASRQREVPIYVVLTMRSDYLGDCSQFWDLPEAVNESQYLIPRLTRDQLREAITGPVAVGGGKITPRLVNRLLNDVGDDQDQLPVLQHLLMRVWDEWKEKRLEVEVKDGQVTVRKPHQEVHEGKAIDLCCYEAVGGMAEALSRHADDAFKELPDDRHREVAEKLFKALTEKGPDNREIRRPITLGEICAITGATAAEVVTISESFRQPGRSFLMPPANVELNSESLIDISHESLIRGWARLKDWVNEEARSARIYRRVADTAVLYNEGGAGLWRDPDLQIALTWREQSKPNQGWARRYHPEFTLAMNFLDESVAARNAQVADEEARRRKEIKRTRLTAVILGVAFLASLGMGGYAVSAKKYAEQQAEAARQSLKEAQTQKANALVQKDAAEKAKIEALGLKTQAEEAKGEALDQKKIAVEQAELAQRNLKEADAQKHIAEQASERFKAEALKGRALGAVKEGNPDEALIQFNALKERCEKMKDPSCQIFALAGIGDIYKDRAPFAVAGLNFTEDPDPPEEGDIDSTYAAMCKQYTAMAALAALAGEGKDEKAVFEKLSEYGKQAFDYYKLALNANKGNTNADQPLREAAILKNLGDLQIFLNIVKVLEETDKDKREVQKAVDGGIQYYLEARAAYVKAQRPLEEAGVMIRIADLLAKFRSTPSTSNPSGQTQAAQMHEDAAELEEIAGFFEAASNAFRRAGRPLKEASALVRAGKAYKQENLEGQRKAILYVERARQIFQKAKSFKKEGDLISVELVHLYASDESKQISLYKEAFEAYRRAASAEQKQNAVTFAKAADMLKKVGDIEYKSNRKDDAKKFFEEAINSSGNDLMNKALILSAIATFYKDKDVAEALKYYDRKRDTWHQAGNFFEEGNTLFEIGSIQNESKNVAGTIESFDTARNVYKQIDAQAVDASGKPLRSALTANLTKMAAIYAQQDKQKAIAAYEEALQIEIFTQNQSPSYNYSILQILQDEGLILLEMKSNEGNIQAERLFQKVIESTRSLKIVNGESQALSTIGDLYKKVGKPAEARAYYERMRLSALTDKSLYPLRDALKKLGEQEVEAAGNQGKTVVDYYLGVAESAGRARDSFTQGAALELAGEFYRIKEAAKAIPYYEQARLAYQKSGLKTQEISVLATLVYLYSGIDKQKSRELQKQLNEMIRTPN